MKITIANNSGRVRDGFTLIETVVGMAVLGIVVFSLYAGINLGFVTIQNARDNLRATQVLTEKMEVVRLCTFDQLTTAGYLPTNFTAGYFEGNSATNGTVFTGSVAIAPTGLGVNYSNDLRLVTVTVAWQTKGLSRSRQLSTLAARSGIQNYVCN